MKRLKGFTLAEVLITLAIIGVVAAISIPSVISNSQQQEFKTGLRKAVSVLNSAITMNMAIDGESPYDNADLFNYLQRHMSVMKTTSKLQWQGWYLSDDKQVEYASGVNGAFYTTDGMRFEFDDIRTSEMSSKFGLKLHESNLKACFATISTENNTYNDADGNKQTLNPCGGCGSYGLKYNPNETVKTPCAILVDVNGDRKPTPQKDLDSLNKCQNDDSCRMQQYKIPSIESNRVSDIFVILITEDRAIPYGVMAQRAMYQAQK